MRFSTRSTVVLPHPDGPMKAVISLAATSRSTSRTAVCPLYFTSRSRISKTSSRASSGGSGGSTSSGAVTCGIGASTPVVTAVTLAVGSAVMVMDASSVVTGAQAACRREKKAVTNRASMVKMNTIRINVSAAPQARSCAPVNGDSALR